jgi:hypothetical protein
MAARNRNVYTEQDSSEQNWHRIGEYLRQLRQYSRLYFCIAALFVVLTSLLYVLTKPTYTAVAVIGPPNPSPMSSMLANQGGGGGSVGGMARRLLGGQSGGSNDPFQEYLQLLRSTRLVTALADRDGMLTEVFDKQWDAQNKTWRPRGGLRGIKDPIKRLLHSPIKEHPDADDLSKFLAAHFLVTEENARKSSILSTTTSGYMRITFEYGDRQKAEVLLDTILRRADDIIREEQARDVMARISYLQAQLPQITQTEQRDAMITTLSGQLELLMMIKADHRYASTLIDPPHAAALPSSPGSILLAIIKALLFAAVVWAALVGLAARFPRIRNLIIRFENPNQA